jgi:hypothetical protein
MPAVRPVNVTPVRGRYERTLPTTDTRISPETGDALRDPLTLRFVPDLADRPYRRDAILQAAAVGLGMLAVYLWFTNFRLGQRPDAGQIFEHIGEILLAAVGTVGAVLVAMKIRQHHRTPQTWRDKADHGIQPILEDEDILDIYPLPVRIDAAAVLAGASRYSGGPVRASRVRHERYLAWSAEASARTWALSPDLGAQSWWDVPVDFLEDPVAPDSGDPDDPPPAGPQPGPQGRATFKKRDPSAP